MDMLTWIKMIIDAIKVFILFIGCTLIFYLGMIWINQEYQNYHRYDEPKNGAVKALNAVQEDQKEWTLYERLVLFYLKGE